MKIKQILLASSFIMGFPSLVAMADPIWKNPSQTPEVRAKALVKAMTPEEKYRLIVSEYAVGNSPKHIPIPKGALGSAGFVPAIERLGIPAQQLSDAGLGVTNPIQIRPGDGATSLPSGQATSGTFNPELAYDAGTMIGKEAYHRGFNVLLAGAMDLVRDPRNGRNFEYLGEDPLLAGSTAAAEVKGIQSQHVISTVKHYAFNLIETNRMNLNMEIAEQPGRESDLLAFEIAIKKGKPGSIMCAYNKVNGIYSCENSYLLQLPKQKWNYTGYIMTDWGAGHSTVEAANAGLDQESAAADFDKEIYFGDPLKEAVKQGKVPQSRVDDMVYRIVYSMIRIGLYDHPAHKSSEPENVAENEAISQKVAEEGSVLLQNNNNLLPLSSEGKTIAIIGGHADKGVLSGGGSSQVTPRGGSVLNLGDPEWPGPIVYNPSAPMKYIQALAPSSHVEYANGKNIQQAVELAKKADVAIVFATKWSAESFDSSDLTLPNKQDNLIEAVAKTAKHVVVVLETGNPVNMPWLNKVDAVLEAWYPGTSGGQAIANLLFGKANPSGRLTTTWPASLDQLPHPIIKGAGKTVASNPSLNTDKQKVATALSKMDLNIEGANVGYRWFDEKQLTPLYPFGYGLSYTNFTQKNLVITNNHNKLNANLQVKNTGKQDGQVVVQLYVRLPDGSPQRLAGFKKLLLKAGEEKEVSVKINPLTLARYNTTKQKWIIAKGDYNIIAAPHALSKDGPTATVKLTAEELAN